MEYQCQENINKARTSIAQNSWEEAADHIALYTPDFACYDEVRKIIKEITDHQCSIYLGKARGAWNARDAQLAGSFLSNISTDSNCASEANELGRKIANSLDAAAKRKWELAYEKYNRDQTLKENKAANEISLANRNQKIRENKSANDISLDNRRQSENEKAGIQRRNIENRNQTLKENKSANDISLNNRNQTLKENKAANEISLANRNQKIRENKSANDISLDNRRQSENEKAGIQRRNIENRNQTLKENKSANDISLNNKEMAYKEKYGFDLEKARIKAARDVGVAHGKNQPKTKVTYNVVGWR